MDSCPMGCADDSPTILGIFKNDPKSRSVNILSLFAVSLSTICRYLPLAIPLFAANFNNLPLFAANYVYRKLPIRVI